MGLEGIAFGLFRVFFSFIHSCSNFYTDSDVMVSTGITTKQGAAKVGLEEARGHRPLSYVFFFYSFLFNLKFADLMVSTCTGLSSTGVTSY